MKAPDKIYVIRSSIQLMPDNKTYQCIGTSIKENDKQIEYIKAHVKHSPDETPEGNKPIIIVYRAEFKSMVSSLISMGWYDNDFDLYFRGDNDEIPIDREVIEYWYYPPKL